MNLKIDKMIIIDVYVYLSYYLIEICICMYMKLYVNYDLRLYFYMKYNN